MEPMNSAKVVHVIPARATSDGAGVRILRSLGQHQNARLDPFLMLDQFASENPDDYIAGFPSHPHRGFQTLTYMLEGHMLHEDHMGNKGHLKSGDVQWMKAGRGIIHSEMPQQQAGAMRGFQLWINLPAAEKMQPADYRDIPSSSMPWHTVNEHCAIKVIAGELNINHKHYAGALPKLSMEPCIVDIKLEQGSITFPLNPQHNTMLYLYEGEISVASQILPVNCAAVLGEGSEVTIAATASSRLLLLSGLPIEEPITQYGPFVMNTVEEVEQALQDYRNGKLTA